VHEQTTDILIVGAGTGGVAAALAALRLGKRVLLSEEGDWIGGQFTAQAVPPDEHPWIEETGASHSYQQFRKDVRQHYRNHYPLKAYAKRLKRLNPGNGFVSGLCHEPKVALSVLQGMLEPFLHCGQLELLLLHKAVSAETEQDILTSVTLENLLPACKNIGTTHITNGCYRLHPVEWAIGEAAGALAAYCLKRALSPKQVRNHERHLRDFQNLLIRELGVVLEWPREIRGVSR
jgi:hypothetical protein